jgi:O-antigen/teichoic acid export membrane protein
VKLTKNFLSLAGAEVISKLATFAAFAYLARLMGPDGFGQIEFAGAVLLCASLIVDQGFSSYGAREIARDPQNTTALVAQIVLARFILATGAYAAMLAMAVWLISSPVVSLLLMIYGSSLLVMPLLLQWVFQGHDQMQAVAVVQVIRQTAFVAIVFAFVRVAPHIHLVAVAEVVAVCMAAAYCVWVHKRRFGSVFQGHLRFSTRLFREGGTIGLSQVFWMVKIYGATLVLGAIASAQELGFFSGAMRILIALHTFVWLYYFNLLPSLSRAWQQGGEAFNSFIDKSVHGMAWLAAAVSVVWALFAPPVMTGVYGPAFEPAGVILQWLAGVCVVAGLSGHYRFGLIAAGRQTAEMMTALLGALTALCGIPIGYAMAGPKGAAIALFIAEMAVWVSAWLCGYFMLGLKGHARLMIRPALAAMVSAAMLWLLSFSIQGINALIGVAAIFILAYATDSRVRESIRRLANFRSLRPLLSRDAPETLR